MRKNTNVQKRILPPDYKYNSPTVTKFINYIMLEGKKSIATKVVYGAFDIVAEKTKKDPLCVFDEALKNVSPALEVKSKRVGGANYQVPIPVRGDRKTMLAMRWIRDSARTKKGKSTSVALAAELIDAANKTGDAMKKKENTERMAHANRAFSHFAR